jgi:hypothetical protein
VLGDSIFAKVVATNSYGSSTTSLSGNGAIILTVPSAPVGLTLISASASVITFSWNNGISTGGAPIADYRVSFD